MDSESLMKSLALRPKRVREDRWRLALIRAVEARSREQVARAIERTVRPGKTPAESTPID